MSIDAFRAQHGSVLVLVAAAIFPFMLLMSYALDASHWFDYSRNLQNRADAAALAAGDQYGGTCTGTPAAGDMAPIGQMAQLFSGPAGSSSDLPYPYSGAGSPLQAFPQYPWATQYQNVPNLTAGSVSGGADYHVLLNAKNFWPTGATGDLGTFCSSDPTLDQTDPKCFGVGTPSADCVAGPMVDVKVTQANLALFFPFVSRPTISAHARVTLEPLASAAFIRPLGVGDASFVPCLKVQFFPAGSSTPTTTVQMQINPALTQSTGQVVWDNSTNNAGTGDPVAIPDSSAGYLYMKAVLSSQGSNGTCNPGQNAVTYPLNGGGTVGLLDLNSAPASPLGTNGVLASGAVPRIDAGGVTLSQGTGNPDQYFSANGDYSVDVTAHVAFSSNAGTTSVWAVDTVTGQMLQLTRQAGTNTWFGSGLNASAQSGQHPICIQVSQTSGLANSQKTTCPTVNGAAPGGATYYSLGVQQQTFSGCNEAVFTCANGSGPTQLAQIGHFVNPLQTDWNQGTFAENTNPNLVIRLELEGLSNAQRTDRCPAQCTNLRLGNSGNGNGAVDCGEGNAASAIEATVLNGCPLFGSTATTPSCPSTLNPSQALYCGAWQKTTDGSCNNTTARPADGSPVNCVNTNNGGANVPQCIAALIQTGGSVNPSNCGVSGSTGCAVDHWLNPPPPGASADQIPPNDPRVISTFVVFSGDLINATGNTPIPIRQFASFYVTGWKYQGGSQVSCPTGLSPDQANEPPPASAAGAQNAVWGHWITFTEPGGGGDGGTCNPQVFGDCVAVLTR